MYLAFDLTTKKIYERKKIRKDCQIIKVNDRRERVIFKELYFRFKCYLYFTIFYIYKCLEDALLQVCLLFLMVFRVVLQIRKVNINVLVFLCLLFYIFGFLTSNMFI